MYKSLLKTDSNLLIHELHFQSLDFEASNDQNTKFFKIRNEDLTGMKQILDDEDLFGKGRSGENHPYMLGHYRTLYGY